MLEKVFISDPDFKYTQYFTFDNFLLVFCVALTMAVIFIIVPDIFTDEEL